MKVVIISASPRKNGNTHLAMNYVFEYVKSKNVDVNLLNLSEEKIECYRGPEEEYNDVTKNAANDVMGADVWLIGSPIYNSFFSSALKNLFEYVNYKKTEGKVAGIVIMAAGNIGFVDVQTMITQLLSYYRVITNPKALFLTVDSVSENSLTDESAKERLREMVDGTLKIAFRMKG
ncbi:MAG: NADPH-dependent FMN reductase [Candidatus Nitrosomaritimum yanchengensis]